MASPFRIMTVCTGNICRSPMAEVVLKARLADAGLGDVVEVWSTGVSSEEHGNPIDRRAAAVLRDAGYIVPRRAARRVTAADLGSADLVLAMTAGHARRLRDLTDRPVVRMYREFDPEAPAVDGLDEHVLDIDDPWYGGMEDFRTTLAQVEAGAEGVIVAAREALAAR
ncbi:low molecular weight protein-tyrosine-phosphatase [Demequina rhizosphaerae]|uniref:low molecular weight protein-tyrosine-phosphatase n=1 Tax=Demequina rhizosphaerae TaxID=1638985 RepID=UPI0007841417|nr:low molecular weight protein-tyrosine-phosphatase [Demequina rhizosphaerae]